METAEQCMKFINDKNTTRMISATSAFFALNRFLHNCSGVSFVDFKQVNAGWAIDTHRSISNISLFFFFVILNKYLQVVTYLIKINNNDWSNSCQWWYFKYWKECFRNQTIFCPDSKIE